MLTDDELIAKHIRPNPHRTGRDEAILLGSNISVWALIGYLPAVDGDIVRVAEDYDIPLEAMQATMAYYQRNNQIIDNRIDANRVG
ncbi:MAG: hypothetical protein NTZ05_09715 [Chloroflexi bacterium]|nr:hypothetical protein [Chloroflexota bacterium]